MWALIAWHAWLGALVHPSYESSLLAKYLKYANDSRWITADHVKFKDFQKLEPNYKRAVTSVYK